jgi:hypothetical protein
LPEGLIYADFLVLLRVYLGWRYKACIQLTVPTQLLPAPVLGETPFILGMTGVLGMEGDECRRTCLRHSLLRQGATAVCRLPSHHKETDVLRTLLIKQLPLLLLPALLTGCGLTQSVSDDIIGHEIHFLQTGENPASGRYRQARTEY